MTLRLLRLICLSLITFSLLSTTALHAQSANNVYSQVGRSVGIVIVSTFEGQLVGSGSAVTVASQTMVTNRHVLLPGHRYQVYVNGGLYEAYMTICDSSQDLCLLEVRNLEAKPVEFGDANKISVGDTVYAIGAPNEISNIVAVSTVTKQKSFSPPQLTLSNGLITALRPVDDGNIIQTNAAISPGSSGGGLFDANGRLLGITTFVMKSGQALNMALPVNWVERLGVTGSPRSMEAPPVVAAAPALGLPPSVSKPVTDSSELHEDIPAQSSTVPAPIKPTSNLLFSYGWLAILILPIMLFVLKRRRRDDDDEPSYDMRPPAPISPQLQRFMDEARQELEQNRAELSLWNIIIADHKGNMEAAQQSYIERRAAKLLSIDKDKQWAAAARQSQAT